MSIVADQLAVMVAMQDSHNVQVHPEWRDQGHEYYRAIWVECAELLDHYGWKWWKQQACDLEQVKLEIVDIWHFGISDLMRAGRLRQDHIDEAIEHTLREADGDAPNSGAGDFRRAVEEFAGITLNARSFDVEAFVKMMRALPMTFAEMYELYVSKNVLNSFRQRNGYKEGRYRKTWAGREDNVHLIELTGTLDAAAATFPDDLARALEQRYADTALPN